MSKIRILWDKFLNFGESGRIFNQSAWPFWNFEDNFSKEYRNRSLKCSNSQYYEKIWDPEAVKWSLDEKRRKFAIDQWKNGQNRTFLRRDMADQSQTINNHRQDDKWIWARQEVLDFQKYLFRIFSKYQLWILKIICSGFFQNICSRFQIRRFQFPNTAVKTIMFI